MININPYREGETACTQGDSRESNPYEVDEYDEIPSHNTTEECKWWYAGYDSKNDYWMNF